MTYTVQDVTNVKINRRVRVVCEVVAEMKDGVRVLLVAETTEEHAEATKRAVLECKEAMDRG